MGTPGQAGHGSHSTGRVSPGGRLGDPGRFTMSMLKEQGGGKNGLFLLAQSNKAQARKGWHTNKPSESKVQGTRVIGKVACRQRVAVAGKGQVKWQCSRCGSSGNVGNV